MTIEKIACPYCGGTLTETEKENVYKCAYCGSFCAVDFVSENQSLLNKLDEEKQEHIANIRSQLYSAITAEYVSQNEVIKHCQELKNYLPDDFMANYFETVARGNAKKINDAINGIAEKDFDYADLVIKFTVKSLKKSNALPLKNFVERVRMHIDGGKYGEYMTAIEKEVNKIDDNTFNINSDRDVFVAYSSKDLNRVMEIVDMLETEEKLDCFVALRNLRKGVGAVENYEEYLHKAMKHCKCVLFLSSVNSRDMECDALDKELPYIKDNLPDMGRIEYILDEYNYNNLSRSVRITLQGVFEGKEWCRTYDDLVGRILAYRRKSTAKTEVKTATAVKFCAVCGTQNALSVKFCTDCGSRDFVSTKAEYFQRLASIQQAERERRAKEEQAEMERKIKEEKARALKDFEIVGTELKKYKGKGGNVVIPNSVKKIGANAFTGCVGLTSVVIPDSVTSIGSGAFNGCSSLESITLPFVGGSKTATEASTSTLFGYIFGTSKYMGGVETKQYYRSDDYYYATYYIPSKLKSVTITGDNMLYGAFYGCSGLTNVTIGNSVTSIGKYAFACCNRLTSVTIGNSVTGIGSSAFSGCNRLTSVTIGNSVTNIGKYAFSDCSGLTSITIGNKVTSIGDSAFAWCEGLTSITIPNSVTNIDKWAFGECRKLHDIFYKGTKGQWDSIKKGFHWLGTGSHTIHFSDGTTQKKTVLF